MPVTQPASMLVTPHTVSPMVSPIIFTMGTTIRFPGGYGRKGGREEGRNGGREEGRKGVREEGRKGESEKGRKGGRKGRREEWRKEGTEERREGGCCAQTPPSLVAPFLEGVVGC